MMVMMVTMVLDCCVPITAHFVATIWTEYPESSSYSRPWLKSAKSPWGAFHCTEAQTYHHHLRTLAPIDCPENLADAFEYRQLQLVSL